jgi:hypothetical protein
LLLGKDYEEFHPASFRVPCNEQWWLQASLPPKLGGMGILDPTAIHHVSFLASEAAVAKSISVLNQIQGAPPHKPSDKAVQCFEEYVDKAVFPTVEEMFEKPLKLQHTLSEGIYKKRREMLIKLSRFTAIRIHSSSEEGSVLITTLPKMPEDSIPKAALMRERLEQRLGLPVSYIVSGECKCNTPNSSKYVDRAGIHLLSQCNSGGERNTTHNAVCDELVHMARAANLTARREDRQIILDENPNSKRRMDVIIDNFENGSPLSIDCSIIDCRNDQYVNNWGSVVAGQAASDREKQKIQDYGPLYLAQGYLFKPFVMESLGRFGVRTSKLFDDLVARVHAARDFMSLASHKQYWRARIGMALHRNAAIGMCGRMKNVLRRRRGLEDSSTAGNMCLPCDKVDMVGYGRCRQ